jgi:ABC-type phosphate transport system substrate-binding protein
MRNLIVASAIAGVLGSGLASAATAPTAAQALAATNIIYISGSSAAKAALKTAIAGADWCNGNPMSAFASGTPDFNAWSCTAAAGPFSGQTTTIYYRAEGGSVVGVLPVINNVAIKQLDLSTSGGCPQTATGTVTCTVGGTSGVNGINDSWTSGVFTPSVAAQIGISDLEPSAFIGQNAPKYTFVGPLRSQAQLSSTSLLPQAVVFQQVFGLIINNSPSGIAGVNNISSQAVRDILAGSLADWSNVPAAGAASGLTSQTAAAAADSALGGQTVAAVSTAVKVCNREAGSGTRTGATLYFLGANCTTTAEGLNDSGTPADNYSTNDEITCVQNNPGSIGYVSIDHQTGLPSGVAALAIDGNLPTNTKAALGQYTWVYEASMQFNPSANPTNKSFYNYFLPKLQSLAEAPQTVDVLAIPNLQTNTAQFPLSTQGVIATSLYTRSGNSCNALASQN